MGCEWLLSPQGDLSQQNQPCEFLACRTLVLVHFPFFLWNSVTSQIHILQERTDMSLACEF